MSHTRKMDSFIKLGLLCCVMVLVVSCVDAQNALSMDQNNLGIAIGLHANTSDTLVFKKALTSLKHINITPNSFKELFSQVTNRLSIGQKCLSDLTILYYILRSPNNYLALQYIDASSKIPNGVLQGKWNWVGDYQECGQIQSVKNPLTQQNFSGQYFSASINVNGKPVFDPYPLVLGVCLPNSCNDSDANDVVNMLINYIKDEVAKEYPSISNVSIQATMTFADKPRKLDGGAKAMISVTAVIVFIVLASTIVDYFITATETKKQDGTVQEDAAYADANTSDHTGLLTGELFSPNIQVGNCGGIKSSVIKLIRVFSVVSNGKKLFGTSTAVGPLACLNGIRVMSMWWVILGHTYAFIFAVMDNSVYAATFIQRFTFQPIMNGTFSVDSFFFLSGLLVAYLALNEIREKGSLSWVYFVVHRYWRLTPLYLFVILYFAYLMPFTSFGPLSMFLRAGYYVEAFDSCKKYWWTNILYINNFYPYYGDLATTCLGWGWYLANDMQFYLVFGTMLVFTLSRYRILGISLGIFFIVAGVGNRVFLVWYYGLHGSQSQPTKHVDDPWGKHGPLYARPYARWSVYVVGMMTGYVLHVTKTQIRIHKLIAVVGWCCAVATALAVIYGQYYYNHHTGTQMTLIASIFYVSLSRTAWGLCLSWVVFACVSGTAGPVKDILSWKIWAPLGRLTYSAYLVHPIVMYTFYFNLNETLHAADLLMIYFFIGHLVISYTVAFIVSMLVEAPMMQLEKLLLKPVGGLGARFIVLSRSAAGSVRGRFRSNGSDL